MLRLILCMLFVLCVYGLAKIDPLVDTKQGLIRGLPSDDGQYSLFLGIPYAVVDEANLFGPSIPHAVFDGVYEAFDDSKICPQIDNNTAIGAIDCLRLNIYVPNTASSQNLLPVMVWIHSGAFIESSGSRFDYSPDFLIRHNVIIVSINYRLGPYGFLCLDIPAVSGNQGLKDQVLAFKWIKQNIQSFGGDPNRVTAFGESSGAKSIHLHLLSDKEKLFNQVIIQSGIAVTPLTFAKPDNTVPLRIANKLGFETDNVEDALIFLANQDVHLLIKTTYDIGITYDTGLVLPETRPCIENKFEGAFITDYPFNLRSTKVRNMPIMFGYNSQESLFKFGNVDAKVFDTYSFKDRLTYGLDLVDDDMVDIVKHFYVGDADVDISHRYQIFNFESDFNFNHPIERTMKRYMDDGATSIYYYVFYYEGGRNFMKKVRNINATGASHVDELGYLFKSHVFDDEHTAEDQHIIDVMTKLWTNFAKYGDPTPETTDLLPVKWLPVTNSKQYYLKIDTELSLLTRPFQERMAFWDLFYKLNGESQNGAGKKRIEL